MQKTVLQQLICLTENYKEVSSVFRLDTDKELYSRLILLFENMKDIERAQIEQAYMDGRNDVSNNDGITPSDYFTSKYGKDETGR